MVSLYNIYPLFPRVCRWFRWLGIFCLCYDSGTSERFLSNYCELPFEKYERSNFFNEPFLITKKPLSIARTRAFTKLVIL